MMFGRSKAAVLKLPKVGTGAASTVSPAAAGPSAPGRPPVPGGSASKPTAPASRPAPKADDRSEQFYDLKTRIHRKLVETLDLTALNQREGDVRAEVRD